MTVAGVKNAVNARVTVCRSNVILSLSDSTRMSFLSWGDIFALPLGGDRIMELKHARGR